MSFFVPLLIERQEFQLVYFSNFSYGDIDEMAPSERETVYNFLIEQKDAEKKAQEERLTKMKQQRAAKSHR